MTPDQQYRTEMLRTAMNAIFPALKTIHHWIPGRFMPLERDTINDIADQIETDTRYDTDENAHAWHRAAGATKRLLADHTKDAVDEWLAAYGELPPMAPPQGLN